MVNHLSITFLAVPRLTAKKNSRFFCFKGLVSIVVLELQEVSRRHNLISQIPTSSEEVRGQRLYRWMELFQPGCDGDFMKAIKVYRRNNVARLPRATVFYIYPVDPDLCNSH